MSHIVTIDPDGRRFDAHPTETLLEAARRNGIDLPHECGWGSCGTCKLTVLSGTTELLFPAAPAVSPRDARTGRTLACQAMARSDLVLRLAPGERAPPPVAVVRQTAELVAVEDLAPAIRRLTFRTDAPADFRPGQYAILHLGPTLRRAYSMCNLPGERCLQFIAKAYDGGAGSTALAALSPGARLVVEAPFGTATLRRRPGRTLFIAGGTGIAPILSLVRQAAAEGLDVGAPVDVLYCARRPADLAAGEELAAAVATLPGGRYRPCVEEGATAAIFVTGRATDALAALAVDPQDVTVYVAGPPAMVASVRTHLREAGVPITRICHDSFG